MMNLRLRAPMHFARTMDAESFDAAQADPFSDVG
jgi:hypothetical protein